MQHADVLAGLEEETRRQTIVEPAWMQLLEIGLGLAKVVRRVIEAQRKPAAVDTRGRDRGRELINEVLMHVIVVAMVGDADADVVAVVGAPANQTCCLEPAGGPK